MIQTYNKIFNGLFGDKTSKINYRYVGRGVTSVLNSPRIPDGVKSIEIKGINIKNFSTNTQITNIEVESENLLGAFILRNSFSTGTLKSIFLYYDANLKIVTKFALHEGANYYKHYQRFISRTL